MPGFDMHIHTTASDGVWTTRQVIEEAKKSRLDGISITDHDTVAAIPEAVSIGEELEFAIIPGIEFSTVWRDHNVHILAYWIDYEDEEFLRYLELMQEDRRTRCRRIADKLSYFGMPIDIEQLISTNGDSIGRPHLAKALVDNGYVENTREAFQKWLAKGAAAYVPRNPCCPFETIELIKKYHGAAVLAHPGKGVPDSLVEQLAMFGLDGIEAYHPEHDRRMSQKYLRMGRFFRIAVTGGSDFHGTRDVIIGTKTTPLYQLELLVRRRQGIK